MGVPCSAVSQPDRVNEPDMNANLPAVAVCGERAGKHDLEEMMARVADAMDAQVRGNGAGRGDGLAYAGCRDP